MTHRQRHEEFYHVGNGVLIQYRAWIFAAAVFGLATPALACRPAPPGLIQAALAAHNEARRIVGVPPLAWSEALACGAQAWGEHLANIGGRTLAHSAPEQRDHAGENLWMGSKARYSLQQMIGSWADERRFYNGAPIGNSNFQAVGHYTQMIWRQTTKVGCEIVGSRATDILVCRYSPAGNIINQRPY